MKCFYHNDADGMCAGYWVANSFHLSKVKEQSELKQEFIEMDYTKEFPIKSIKKNEQIYIVDFSISTKDMDRLLNITKNVIWIDHHKTSIEKYKNYPYNIDGIRYDGVSGCMLAYCYFNHMLDIHTDEVLDFNIEMTKNAPFFTKLIDDWDVWKFEYGDNTRFFSLAFTCYDFSPTNNNWDMFDKMKEMDLIEEGKVMYKYRSSWAKEYCKTKGFEMELDGKSCFAINLGQCNSTYFDSIDKKYDMFVAFCLIGNNWSVSLYSKNIDVSEIAKNYGGGGHAGASGFVCQQLPFNI